MHAHMPARANICAGMWHCMRVKGENRERDSCTDGKKKADQHCCTLTLTLEPHTFREWEKVCFQFLLKLFLGGMNFFLGILSIQLYGFIKL